MNVLRSLLVLLALSVSVVCPTTGNQSFSTAGSQADRPTLPWRGGTVITQKDVEAMGIDRCFTKDTIGDALFARMNAGGSWKSDAPASLRQQLRYLRMLHHNADGQPQMGEMVVHKAIADKVLRIFRRLYDKGYRIERMVLIDEYHADDELSMRANNTSAFNFRFMANSKTAISKHGYGLAIDLNTLYNPYVKAVGGKQPKNFSYERPVKGIDYDFEPATGQAYAFHRTTRTDIPYKIDHADLAYRLFIAEGFTWGGDWKSLKDYQHFEFSAE